MTRVNRISGLRPPVAISRMPEKEMVFTREEMRQRARLEDEARQQQQPRQEPPPPEEQAQRKAERVVVEGAAREAIIRPHDPTVAPALSVTDLFHRAKEAGLHEDEIAHIQFRFKKLRAQERTQELRFLQERVLPARNWAQAFRTYADINALFGRYPDRLPCQVVQSIISGLIERPTGKQKIPMAVLRHQEAVEAALLIPQITDKEFDQICSLLKDAAMKAGQKIRDADPEAERAFILKAAALRSNLFLNPDSINILRSVVGLPNEAIREIQLFAGCIRGIPARDLIDFAHKPITLASEEEITAVHIKIQPKNYLSDGFFTAKGELKSELMQSWSRAMANQIAQDGMGSARLGEIVNQLSHIALEFQKRSGTGSDQKLDTAILSVVNLVFDSEEVVQCPSLWEIMDVSRQWLTDLRSLAALTLHLDAIRVNLG
ncbi:MAG TPA: hypothetical protein VLH08_17165 [Acidobacteriota bacterium]|nr:hypothetical protein [Acidobacteriota bacterium]